MAGNMMVFLKLDDGCNDSIIKVITYVCLHVWASEDLSTYVMHVQVNWSCTSWNTHITNCMSHQSIELYQKKPR